MSTYNTIFKEVDSILGNNLASISLSLQRAQMKQTLLYQEILITINQVKEWNVNYNDIIKQLYKACQIHLAELMTNISFNTIKELWKCSNAVSEDVSEELTGILMQFIMKYYYDTGLGIKDTLSLPSTMLQEFFTATKVIKSIFTITEITDSTSNATEVTESISNLVLISFTTNQKYSTSDNKLENTNTVLKTCSYCSDKGHNIHSCQKYKSDEGNKENC
ncbi:1101_t:CDS:2 [Cetraspora pellucida]|uniref:1101_t:CDS:1 n=1 Tax=Cetraspora pellucida TaxID=1433469 RepID=A0ACA9MQ49_9GLOM|nr:1101_t:CDS:2 [Cetraspora pellucida]